MAARIFVEGAARRPPIDLRRAQKAALRKRQEIAAFEEKAERRILAIREKLAESKSALRECNAGCAG